MRDVLNCTTHAKTRMQQRAICPLVIDWLQRYGSRQPAAASAELVFFDRSARRRLEHDVGRHALDRLDHLLDAYLVESHDGVVITVGWRTKRVRRDATFRNRTRRCS